jgi:hypothetical protein
MSLKRAGQGFSPIPWKSQETYFFWVSFEFPAIGDNHFALPKQKVRIFHNWE